MMARVLLASANRGKIAELQALLGDLAAVVSLADLDLASPEETGATFADNATLKATAGAAASGLITVADDSGIEVPALGGEPGVRSARYAGEHATDADNSALLLTRLRERGLGSPAARFVSVIAVATPAGEVETFSGTLDGQVTDRPRGGGGFGYDPIMELPDGRTVAELTADEKNRISHRGTALRKALPYLKTLLEPHATETEGPV